MKHSSGAQSGAFSKGFRPNMSATWVQLGVNFREDDPNLVPTWAPHAAIWHHMWTCLGGASVEITSRMGQHGEHGPCDTKSSKHANRGICTRVPRYGFFGVDEAAHEAMFPMFCLRGAQLGAKLPPNGTKLRHVGPDLDLHVHSMASTWAQVGPLCG